MKAIRVRTSDYTRAGHAAFQRKFSKIVHSIVSHPEVFSDLPIQPSELEAVVKSLMEITNEANGGSRVSRDERNVLRAYATSILNTLSLAVAKIALAAPTEEERLAIIRLTAFAPVKTKYEKINEIGQVQLVKGAWTGKEGEALIRWKKISAGVAFYDVEKAFSDPADPATTWHFAGYTSRRKIIINDLLQLSKCWVRVTAHGVRNMKGTPSAPTLIAIG